MDPNAVLIEVDPEWAARFPPWGRPDRVKVARYAELIRAGGWVTPAEAPVDHVVIDIALTPASVVSGRHRMAAVVAAGVAVPLWVRLVDSRSWHAAVSPDARPDPRVPTG